MAGIEWFCPWAVSRIVRVNQGAQHASQIQSVTFSCPSCSAARAPGCATPTSSALRALPLRLHGDDRRMAGNVPDEARQFARDIVPGTIISAGDLSWEAWPRQALNSAFITRSTDANAVQDLSGAVARTQFFSGEPVRESKLVKAGAAGYMSAILPAGKRAVATRTSPQTGAGGFILPNDHVGFYVGVVETEVLDKDFQGGAALRLVRHDDGSVVPLDLIPVGDLFGVDVDQLLPVQLFDGIVLVDHYADAVGGEEMGGQFLLFLALERPGDHAEVRHARGRVANAAPGAAALHIEAHAGRGGLVALCCVGDDGSDRAGAGDGDRLDGVVPFPAAAEDGTGEGAKDQGKEAVFFHRT